MTIVISTAPEEAGVGQTRAGGHGLAGREGERASGGGSRIHRCGTQRPRRRPARLSRRGSPGTRNHNDARRRLPGQGRSRHPGNGGWGRSTGLAPPTARFPLASLRAGALVRSRSSWRLFLAVQPSQQKSLVVESPME